MNETKLLIGVSLLFCWSTGWSAPPAQDRGYSAWHDYRVVTVA